MKNITLYYEPRKLATEKLGIGGDNKTEMTVFESAFLCGLIKERRPTKVVEVGIAGGGTTAILLQCFSLLELHPDFYSVDLSERYYRDTSKQSGFLGAEMKSLLSPSAQHQFLLGKLLPEQLDVIGDNIDFVILDTMHITPGELLDFIAVLPYLADNACVVLHDVGASHYWGDKTTYATQLLLDVVTAEKVIMKDTDRELAYPNIAAFFVNNDTKKYAEDVFHALSIPWHYKPDAKHLQAYRRIVAEKYSEKFIETFDIVVALQQNIPMYTYGTKLSFAAKDGATALPYCVEGFSSAEEYFTWTDGTKAEMKFRLPHEEKKLQLTFAYDIFHAPQRIEILANGNKIDSFTAASEGSRTCSFLSTSARQNGLLTLTFLLPDAISPFAVSGGTDTRILAFAFQTLSLHQASTEDKRSLWSLRGPK